MAVDPQVIEQEQSSVMQGQQDSRARSAVSERDLDRFRSAYDKKIADLQRLVDRAEGRAKRSETQLRAILDQAEKGMMAKMKPEEQARYEADKARREAESAKTRLRAAKAQEALDAKRDRLLDKYGLTGREKGLNYQGDWEDFAESAIAVSAARALTQITRKQSAQKVEDAVRHDQTSAPQRRVDPPRVDTRSSSGAAITNGGTPSQADVESMARQMVTGTPAQRRAAAEKLKQMRSALIV